MTMETSSDDALTIDEVVVAAAVPVSQGHTGSDPLLARRASISDVKPRPHPQNPDPSASPSRAQSPSPAALQRRTPDASDASPGDRPARASEGTPSRATRFSIRDEVRDSQSPPPSTKSAARQQDPTPQPSIWPSNGRPAPSTQTPKKMGWTVDKIATALADLSEDVSQGHARLVDFVLEEAEKKAPKPRHLSTIDTFASMQSIALDSSASPPSGVETMAVKFKASCSRAARLMRHEC